MSASAACLQSAAEGGAGLPNVAGSRVVGGILGSRQLVAVRPGITPKPRPDRAVCLLCAPQLRALGGGLHDALPPGHPPAPRRGIRTRRWRRLQWARARARGRDQHPSAHGEGPR
jgi:hypothetical protein